MIHVADRDIRQQALVSVLAENPDLINVADPESLARLNDLVDQVEQQMLLQAEIEEVRRREFAEQARAQGEQARRERAAAEQARKEEEQRERLKHEAAKKAARDAALSKMNPVSRWIRTHQGLSIGVAAALGIGIVILAGQMLVRFQADAELAAATQAAAEAKEAAEAEEAAQVEAAAAELERLKAACSVEVAGDTTDIAILEAYIDCPDAEVRRTVADSLKRKVEGPQRDEILPLLGSMIEDSDDEVRNIIAGGYGVPDSLLSRLVKDSSRIVRESVASNHNSSAQTLTALAQDQAPQVRAAAARKQALPEAALLELSKDPEPMVREAVALNESAPLAALDRLSSDEDAEVLLAVIINDRLNAGPKGKAVMEKVCKSIAAKPNIDEVGNLEFFFNYNCQ